MKHSVWAIGGLVLLAGLLCVFSAFPGGAAYKLCLGLAILAVLWAAVFILGTMWDTRRMSDGLRGGLQLTFFCLLLMSLLRASGSVLKGDKPAYVLVFGVLIPWILLYAPIQLGRRWYRDSGSEVDGDGPGSGNPGPGSPDL